MLRTCAKCDYLQLHVNTVNGLAWAACGRIEGDDAGKQIVPQNTKPIERPKEDGSPVSAAHFRNYRSTFWRVPMWCPRIDTDKIAAPHKQPMHLWEQRDWHIPGERIE